MPKRDLRQVLHELDRLAGLIFRRVVVVVEFDLARIDALGAAVEARRPAEQVRPLCVVEVARPDDMNVVERLVVLAREVPAHAGAQVLGVERVVEIVQLAVLDVGDARMADAHLDVRIGAGPAPLGPEREKQITGLEEPAFPEAPRHAGARREHHSEPCVAAGLDRIRMLEIDEKVGSADVLRHLGAGARRQREVDWDIELLRQPVVLLLAEAELLRLD